MECSDHPLAQVKPEMPERIIECLKTAEDANSEGVIGVFQTDLWKIYRQKYLGGEISPFESFDFDEQLTNTYRLGVIYARSDYNKFSAVKHPGFATYQENFDKVHAGYALDSKTGLVQTPATAVAYQDLKQNLLKPAGPWDESKIFVKNCDQRVAYTSYSRSGNTMLRTYFERVTGAFTGSDGDLNACLHYSLQHAGFTAEAHLQDAWIIKTHYPLGKDRLVTASKVICCVRNPLDVVTSMFNFWATQTQNLSVKESFGGTDDWQRFVRQEISNWRDFHNYWKTQPNVYFVRFEDLRQDPQQVLEGVFKYIFDLKTLDGTQLKANIDLLAEQTKPQLYKPRSQGVAKSNPYSPEQIEWIRDHLKLLLTFFGYEAKFDLMGANGHDFREFNRMLDSGKRQEQTLEGVNVRAMPGQDGAKDRQLYNFNHLQLIYHPVDQE